MVVRSVSMVEGQEARDTWTSTSCRSEQRGCRMEEKTYYSADSFITRVSASTGWGSQRCTRSESSQAFLESGQSKRALEQWRPAREVHLDIVNGCAAVFLQGLFAVTTISHDKLKPTRCTNVRTSFLRVRID